MCAVLSRLSLTESHLNSLYRSLDDQHTIAPNEPHFPTASSTEQSTLGRKRGGPAAVRPIRVRPIRVTAAPCHGRPYERSRISQQRRRRTSLRAWRLARRSVRGIRVTVIFVTIGANGGGGSSSSCSPPVSRGKVPARRNSNFSLPRLWCSRSGSHGRIHHIMERR